MSVDFATLIKEFLDAAKKHIAAQSLTAESFDLTRPFIMSTKASPISGAI